jgi:hypothetical protein
MRYVWRNLHPSFVRCTWILGPQYRSEPDAVSSTIECALVVHAKSYPEHPYQLRFDLNSSRNRMRYVLHNFHPSIVSDIFWILGPQYRSEPNAVSPIVECALIVHAKSYPEHSYQLRFDLNSSRNLMRTVCVIFTQVLLIYLDIRDPVSK